MVRTKSKVQQVVQEDIDDDDYQVGDELEDMNGQLTRELLNQQLKNRITNIEGEQKIAFAALYELYGKQQQIDDEEEKEVETIKQKYRLKAEELLNKTRKIVLGDSTENALLSNSEILTADEKAKTLKNISLPNFWSDVLKNSSFNALINEDEELAIDSIKNILVNYVPTTKTLNIEIHFGQNPILSNNILKASLSDEPTIEKKHTFETPKYKPEFAKSQEHDGFLSLFEELQDMQISRFFDYWMNFYEEELPHALAFYFQLREGSMSATMPAFMGGDEDDDNEDEQDDDQQDDEDQKAVVSKNTKGKKNSTKKSIQKPECKQQ